jgi:YNFM family putative membrane transporter
MDSNTGRQGIEGRSFVGLQFWVFSLVAAAFTNIYITQPVLPVLQIDFGVDEALASLTISAVIFGIALSNLPLGSLADRFAVKPIICIGGCAITLAGLVCATTDHMSVLIGARFVQGLFIPCVTTCVAAYLARTLPLESLNVVMGAYVAATVAGGLGGRLLGGLVHSPLHWRYAFVSASALLLTTTLAACRFLPREAQGPSTSDEAPGFLYLIARPDLLRIFSVSFSAFFVFSSVFNYLPFYLSAPPFEISTGAISLMYLSYLIGIVVSPLSGKLSNRMGNGTIMALGAVVFAAGLGSTLIPMLPVIAASLALICAGFFSVHSAAVGSLNRRLHFSRGRANSLYVLSYYLGGFVGISMSGYMYISFGWPGIIGMGAVMLIIPFSSGLWEVLTERDGHGQGS